MRWLLLALCAIAARADVCDPAKFEGTYGLQISGTALGKPVASIGQLTFDGKGTVGGVTSVNYAGYFLGNPVTGSYEARTDCSVVLNLQDDSGGLQHFRGTFTGDAKQMRLRQTDPDVTVPATLVRTPKSCDGLDGDYVFTISGNTVELDTGKITGSVSLNGFFAADASGALRATPDRSTMVFDGSFHKDDGCFVQIEIPLPVDGVPLLMKFRAIVVEGEVLGVRTDPATAVILRMRPTGK
jgi:hypothetical protein